MDPTISVLICSHGDDSWRRLGAERALPSALFQGADEVRHWHAPELSLAEVRNAAAAEAVGSLLCFLDADDELGPAFIPAMREAAAQRVLEGPALLYPWAQFIERGRERRPGSLNQHRPLIEINRAVIGSVVPRDLFLEVGGFGEEPIYEDWSLWLKLSELIPLVEVPKAVYRIHRGQGRNLSRELMEEWYWRIRREHEVRRA